MKYFLRNWSPVLAFVLAIFICSSLQVHVTDGTDKVVHALEYAVMGFFTTRGVMLSWELPRFRGAALGAFIAAALGVLDEFHQYFVPGRQASVGDALADAAGAILGAALFVFAASLLFHGNRLHPRAQDKCC
jgi:VanZ family protein